VRRSSSAPKMRCAASTAATIASAKVRTVLCEAADLNGLLHVRGGNGLDLIGLDAELLNAILVEDHEIAVLLAVIASPYS
jgi:hypothetical protein